MNLPNQPTPSTSLGNASKFLGLVLIFISIVLVILEDEFYFASYSADKTRLEQVVGKTTTTMTTTSEGSNEALKANNFERGIVVLPDPLEKKVRKPSQRWMTYFNSSAVRSGQPWDWVPMTGDLQARYHKEEWRDKGQCVIGATGGAGGHQKPRTQCRIGMRHMKFVMESGRELFSLEDTLELIAHQNNGAKRVSVIVLGDSVSDQYYEGMNCNLLRNCWVSRGWNHTRNMASDVVWAFNRLSWFDSHFTNPATGMEADLVLLRQYAPSAETPWIVHFLACKSSEFDVIIFNWGLHFQRSQRAAGDVYAAFARRLSRAVRCTPEESRARGKKPPALLMYLHPVAQHFPNTRCGYYEMNRTEFCYAIVADEFEEKTCLRNWRGTDLRRVFANETDSRLTYIETPWTWSTEEVCAEPFRTAPPPAQSPEGEDLQPVLHGMPNYELTEPFHVNHPAKGDCTHFCYYPEYHEPLHDALYLAAKLRDRTYPSRCVALPRVRRRVNTPDAGNLHCSNVNFAEFQNGRNEGFDDEFSSRHPFWPIKNESAVSRLFKAVTQSPTFFMNATNVTMPS